MATSKEKRTGWKTHEWEVVAEGNAVHSEIAYCRLCDQYDMGGERFKAGEPEKFPANFPLDL